MDQTCPARNFALQECLSLYLTATPLIPKPRNQSILEPLIIREQLLHSGLFKPSANINGGQLRQHCCTFHSRDYIAVPLIPRGCAIKRKNPQTVEEDCLCLLADFPRPHI